MSTLEQNYFLVLYRLFIYQRVFGGTVRTGNVRATAVIVNKVKSFRLHSNGKNKMK